MKRIRKPLHCRADFSWLAPLVLAYAAASGWRRCFWLAPLLLAGAAGAARAREKASWRRRRVPFRSATGLPRCRCCGAKPRHATSAPQERGRLAGFREDSSLRQGLIAWNCGASQGKSKLAPPESSIPGATGLVRRRCCGAKPRHTIYAPHAEKNLLLRILFNVCRAIISSYSISLST